MDQEMLMRASEITAETERAMSIHPPINSAHEAYAVIKEELEEFWDLVVINPNKLDAAQRAVRLEQMRKELTQTAAMCLRTMMDLAL
jgi:hypothetical protein